MLAIQPEPYTNYLEPQHWQTDVLLARAPGRTANFVIISPAENVHRKYVLATFGQPAGTYRYGPFTIMVWHKNLLPYLVSGPRARPPRRHRRRGLPGATAGASGWPAASGSRRPAGPRGPRGPRGPCGRGRRRGPR